MYGNLTLEVIVYNGRKYKLTNRTAKVGDLITYVFEGHNTKEIDGVVSLVVRSDADNVEITPYFDNNDNEVTGINHLSYRVLEPVEDEGESDELSSPDLADLVIRLSQTVARQQSEIDTLKADLQSFAETATEADYKAGQALTSSSEVGELSDKVDMITDDIVMLDERTQPLVDDNKSSLSTELADAFIMQIRERL